MHNHLSELDERLDSLAIYHEDMPAEWLKFQRKYEMCLIYHETLLDGNAVSGDEILAALSSAVTNDISQVSTFRRVRNYHNGIEFIRQRAAAQNPVIDLDLFRELQTVLANGLDTNLGRFRRNSPVHRAYYQDICAPGKIEGMMNDMIAMVLDEMKRSTLHPIELAGRVHYRFMKAYPFSYWSGVVGRYFTNMLLLNSGRLPVIIHCHDRQRYYSAVATSPAAVTMLLTEAYENSLDSACHHFVETRQLLAQA